MRLPAAFAAILVALCLIAPEARANWNPDWTKRAKITLNTAAEGVPIGAPIDNVPVLVRLHTGNFSFADAAVDGADLRFIAGDDKTPLKFHVEKFDGLNELALVWVTIPKLAAGRKDDFIWVYYGNPKATPAGDARSTYDASQAAVFHFGETQGLPMDSTANGNHASKSGAKPSAAGVAGGAVSFDGAGPIELPGSPSLKGAGGGLTVSAWVKLAAAQDAMLFSQGEGGAGVTLALKGGKLVGQAGRAVATAPSPLPTGTWTHVALILSPPSLAIYVDGREVARAEGSVPPAGGGVAVGAGIRGEMDQLEIATVARPADWIRLSAAGQGPDQRLVSVAPQEGDSGSGEGASYLRILLSAVTIDGWVVIAILMVMLVFSFWVMVSKTRTIGRAARANEKFLEMFRGDPMDDAEGSEGMGDADAGVLAGSALSHSPLYRLYQTGLVELRKRLPEGGRGVIGAASLDAIRASVDARMLRETQSLNSRMVVLTISIAGGPFLGLLGTVVGVMITFAAIAAAGDVNVNAIAPGIAAALVATVAGLAVAIPALFGYNYLTGRIADLSADMQVFADELLTRFSERHSAEGRAS